MDKKANANKLISSMVALTLATTLGVPMAALADTGDEAGSLAANSESQPASGDVAGAYAASQQGTDESQPADNSQSKQGAAGSAQAVVPQSEGVAEVNGTNYPSLQAAIDAAPRNATVKLLADTKENVAISANAITLDLNGYTLNGSTGERKPALTINAVRVTVQDSSEAQTGTIMREDTAENSGVSSHYVIDLQGKNGFLLFNSGTVKNNSGAGGTKGASLVRIGSDSNKKAHPVMTIAGGTFTQDNFIAIKVDFGTLYVKGGVVNSKNSYAIENWLNANIKGNAVINGNVSSWTYAEGSNSNLNISGGIVNGNVESVTYDGAEGKTAKVSITGGVVNGTLNTFDYSTGTTSNDPTKATIEVTGGTFSTDPSRYLIEGSAATPNGDGTFGVEKAYLARVGETSYYTMDEAFKAQTETGKAITLLRDYTTGSTFNSGTEARVVDLNGHTWTCTGTDANSAAFEINYPNASLTVKNGKIVSSQLVGLIPSAMGGTITYDNSTLTFEGVEATTTATSGIETNGNNTNDTVVLKDSTLNVPNGFGVYFPCSGALNIENSTITTRSTGVQVCAGNLSLKGSTITTEGQASAKTENDGAILDGAAISVIKREGYKDLGKVEISGGNYTSGQGVNAIKAYQWNNSSKTEETFDDAASVIAVTGGTFSTDPSTFVADGYKVVENGGRFTVALNAVTPNPGISSTETTTTTNPDGTTTTTVTDKKTGESTSTTEGANGTTVVEKTDASGNTTTKVTVPEGAATNAGAPVEIPAAVEVTKGKEVSISAPAGTIVAIPAAADAGNVAVIVHADGTETVIPMSLVEGGKAIVKLDGDETIKIVDNAKDFSDVPAEHWAADDIDFASSHEIFKGIGNGNTYEPETALTRNMMMTVLARTAGADTSESDPWYAKGQAWAVENGVSNGLWGEDNITREQLVTMLFNFANLCGLDTSARADVSGMVNADAVSDWATEAVQWAVAEGILKGVDNIDLAPQGLATRAQAAAFMQRYVKTALL